MNKIKIYQGKTEEELNKELKELEQKYNNVEQEYNLKRKIINFEIGAALVNLVVAGALIKLKSSSFMINGACSVVFGIMLYSTYPSYKESEKKLKKVKLEKEKFIEKMPIEISEFEIK